MVIKLQKLKNLSDKYNLSLFQNDRLFYRKYLYRISYTMNYRDEDIAENWQFKSLQAQQIRRWTIILQKNATFINTMRSTAKQFLGQVRVEGSTLNYYTNDIEHIEKLCMTKISNREISICELAYSPGTDCKVRYRKTKLPHNNKYRFQIWCKYKSREQAERIVKHYSLDHVKLVCNNDWSEPIIYVNTKEMMHLLIIALGTNFKRMVEYKLLPME